MAHGWRPWQVVDEGCERRTRTCWGARSAGSPEDWSLAGPELCLQPWNMAEGWWTSSLPAHMSPLDAKSCRPLRRCLSPNSGRSRRSSAQESPGERHYQSTHPPDHLHTHLSRLSLQRGCTERMLLQWNYNLNKISVFNSIRTVHNNKVVIIFSFLLCSIMCSFSN